jgi:Tfp pilus assembly protein PilO
VLVTLGRRGIFAVGAVVGVIVLVAGWLLLVSPARSDISKTKAAAATQSHDNDSARIQLATMRGIAKNLPQEQAELALLNQRVPNAAQLPALLRQIRAAADSSGVSLDNLTPTVPAPLTDAPGISAVSISMEVTGGYADVEQFDDALESLKRTFLVSGFTMTGGASAAGSGSTGSTSTSTSTDANQITTAFSGQVLLNSAATATTGS